MGAGQGPDSGPHHPRPASWHTHTRSHILTRSHTHRHAQTPTHTVIYMQVTHLHADSPYSHMFTYIPQNDTHTLTDHTCTYETYVHFPSRQACPAFPMSPPHPGGPATCWEANSICLRGHPPTLSRYPSRANPSSRPFASTPWPFGDSQSLLSNRWSQPVPAPALPWSPGKALSASGLSFPLRTEEQQRDPKSGGGHVSREIGCYSGLLSSTEPQTHPCHPRDVLRGHPQV